MALTRTGPHRPRSDAADPKARPYASHPVSTPGAWPGIARLPTRVLSTGLAAPRRAPGRGAASRPDVGSGRPAFVGTHHAHVRRAGRGHAPRRTGRPGRSARHLRSRNPRPPAAWRSTALLWLRGDGTTMGAVPPAGAGQGLERLLDRALKAVNLVLQAGGFDLAVLDLSRCRADAIRRLPFTTWFAPAAGHRGQPHGVPAARAGADCAERRGGEHPAGARVAPAAPGSAQLFLGLDIQARVVRARARTTAAAAWRRGRMNGLSALNYRRSPEPKLG